MRLIKLLFLSLSFVVFGQNSSNAQPLLSGYFVSQGFDPDASAVIAQMTANGSTPSAARQILINQLVLDLKGLGNTGTADIWSLLDILQIYAAEDEIQALTEWKQADGSYDASKINSPTFTANVGYTGNNTNRIESNWALNSNLGNYTQNNASFGGFGNVTALNYFCGTAPSYLTYIRVSTIPTDQSLNNSGFPSGNWGASGQHSYVLDRSLSTEFEMYLDGNVVDTVAATSAALTSATVASPNINNFSNNTINCLFMGASLKPHHAQLYNSLNNYLSAL